MIADAIVANGFRRLVTLTVVTRIEVPAPVVLLAGLLAGCIAKPTSLGEPVGSSSDGSSSTGGESSTADGGSSDGTGQTTSGEAASSEDGTTSSNPPPPGGLGPWGFGYVELPQIEAEWLGFADFDGDGHVDVFARREDPGDFVYATATIFFGDGSGSFVEGPARVISWQIEFMQAGDYDGDGDLDAAIFGDYGNAFGVMLNDGTGTLMAPNSVQVEGFYGFGTKPMRDDLDGDDDLFIPLGHSQGGMVAVADGAGDFSSGASVPAPACYFSNTAVADLDGDDLDEIVATGSCNDVPGVLPLVVYRHVGGVLTANQTIIGELGPVYEGCELALVDADDDGDLDVVTGTELGLYVLENVGGGVLADPPQVLPHAYDGYIQRVIPIHLDGGDTRGVVLAAHEVHQLQPALVVPDAAWASSITHSLDLQGRVAGSADFDGDGLTDVAVLVGEDPAVLGLWLSGG